MLMDKLFLILGALMLSTSYAQNSHEEATEKYFAAIKTNQENRLRFLYAMPKGGELHDHLGGAGMAENMIGYAKGDGFCVDRKTLGITINPHCLPENCLDTASQQPDFYDAIIDAWSMRHFQAKNESAHDHAFAAFGKFSPIVSLHSGEILAEMAQRAAEQNEQYLEVLFTPDNNESGLLGKQIAWNPDFSIMRQELFKKGLKAIINKMPKQLDAVEATMAHGLQCKSHQAKSGCQIKIRYLYQVYREQAPVQVFAQLLAGFELANQDSRVVGINMVQAENGMIAMRDYHLHMQMLAFLHQLYPTVHISLHAGESGPAIAPPEALRFHIQEAVDIAQAERIGHGLDISFEDHPTQLLTEMATKHILVETTPSTELILGFEPKQLPFPIYVKHNVPIALSTDDEGVFRTNLTEQFENIVATYPTSYLQLKTLVRNSIAYSFIPGKSLWLDDQYHQVIPACANDVLGSKTPSSICQRFLTVNEKAQSQWELEQRFDAFETRFAK